MDKNMNLIRKYSRQTSQILVFLLLLSIVVISPWKDPQVAKAAWYSDTAWLYRQKIVIDHTKVANSDQTDFPVMLKVTNQYNPIFTGAKDDGTDILFTSDNGSTKLSHEIDTFSKTSKELIVWIKIPTLSYTVDTTLYMYYGNASSVDQQNKTDVWSNGYLGVWHMGDGDSTAANFYQDSTINDFDGTLTDADGDTVQADGRIGKAVAFNGDADTLATSLTNQLGDFSACAWFYNTGADNFERIFDKSYANGFWIGRNGTTANSIGGGVLEGSPFGRFIALADGYWHYICSTRSGTAHNIIGNGGALTASGVVTSALTDSTALNIGGGANPSNMTIDEPRIASVARSADWIRTEYNNQSDPESFITINYELSQANYQTAAEISWISTLWLYKQKIQISNNTASNLYNIQTVISSSDINMANVFAKAKTNGEDIRFTSLGSNVELPYYIESYSSAGSSARIHVKIPFLPASGSTYIYLYYGNPSVSESTSSGANTFTVFDDFANGSIDSRWTVTSGNGTISESGGVLNFNYVGAENNDWWSTGKPQKIIKLNTLPGGDFEASVKLNSYTPGISTHAGISALASDTSAYTWGRYYGSGGTVNNFQLERLGAGSISTLANTALPKFLAIRKIGATYSFWSSADRITWTKTGSDYSDVVLNNIALYGKEWGSNNLVFSQDDFIIKTIASTAPTTTLSGSEEILDADPPTNPSAFVAKNVSGGAVVLNSANFYNYPTPHFDWPAVDADGGASDEVTGVDGYYLYFGTNCGGSGADPAQTRGLLSDLGGGLHFTSNTEISAPELSTPGTYCLRLKTKDVTGNSSSTVEAFVYKFEATPPSAPTYIASNPAGYSSTNSFSFTWPAVADTGGSGLAGYQYKRGGTSGDDWSETITETSISNIVSYDTGENIFIVRAVDNAGNISPEAQTNYYYASNAPSEPTSLVASPLLSDENAFTFSWVAPDHGIAIEEYGYSINAAPTSQNITWTGSADTALAEGAYATKQGVNTLYLVAKDTAGNYSFDEANYASVDFTCQTVAPPTPVAVSAVDSSDRAINRWMITTQWAAGTGQDAETFDHYSIERSTDGSTFTELATTTSPAYIDADLSNSITYYYRIKAVDNAGSSSVASATVSKIPTGNYPTPPTIVSDPVSEVKATSATVTWVTNRASTGAVKFGRDQNKLDRSQLDAEEETEHQITLPGLEPSTTYYFKVQSLDSARDYSENDAYSSIFTLKTLAAPGIQNVKITNISLTSADVSWETSSASTGLIRYGTSINYDKSWEEASSFTTNHTYKLENLSHTTTYHFKISGLDSDENSINSDDYVFDTLPLPKISAVTFDTDYSEAEPQTSISWTTNVATTSSVEYFPKSGGNVSYEESQSDLITSHKVKLTKLSDDTSYSFYVSGTDQFGNKATSDEYIFNTPFDSRPAKITDVQVEPSNVGLDKQDKAQMIISWKTDEPATTQVEYGEGITGDFTNKTSEDKTLTNEHFVIISDLEPNKPYHLKAISKDKGGNESLSEEVNSIPGEVPRSLLKVLFSTFENIFGWMTKFI